VTGLLAAAVPAQTTAADTGSPGLLGFVATFVLALAVIGLMLSLTRHLRRVAASPDPAERDDDSLGDGASDDTAPDAALDDTVSDDTVSDDARPDAAGRGAPDGAGGPS